LRVAAAKSTGGRPGTAYHLNEEQALLICMLSRTERAKQVRAEVIRVFAAWRRGQRGPGPDPRSFMIGPVPLARGRVSFGLA